MKWRKTFQEEEYKDVWIAAAMAWPNMRNVATSSGDGSCVGHEAANFADEVLRRFKKTFPNDA